MALPGSLVGIEKRLGERKEEEAGEKERGECSPLVQKSDSGSHYTMGSFVSHLFAILHCYFTRSPMDNHFHICEIERQW